MLTSLIALTEALIIVVLGLGMRASGLKPSIAFKAGLAAIKGFFHRS